MAKPQDTIRPTSFLAQLAQASIVGAVLRAPDHQQPRVTWQLAERPNERLYSFQRVQEAIINDRNLIFLQAQRLSPAPPRRKRIFFGDAYKGRCGKIGRAHV